jgi:hypothetical protein
MLSAVCRGPMIIGNVACGPDPSVLLAAPEDFAADPADARVVLSGARAVRVVAVAAVAVLGGGPLEHVLGALEGGELGSPILELDPKLAKSSSCDRPAVSIGHDATGAGGPGNGKTPCARSGATAGMSFSCARAARDGSSRRPTASASASSHACWYSTSGIW